jgi:hypothetical protein
MLVGGSFALADETPKPTAPPTGKLAAPPVTAKAKGRVLLFGEGDGAARFHVERNASAGRMTFRLADPAFKIESAPVIVMKTESGPQEVTLVADESQPGTWVWTHDTVKTDRFDGSMRVAYGGKTYTSNLGPVWTTETTWAPRYGGRILELSDCGAGVEIVQDLATGTLTIYSFDEVIVTEAPVITVKETSGPTTVTLTKVAGKNGVWVTKHERFKTTTTSATIRVLVNGKPCEVPLTYGSGRGGRMLTVDGGPGFEVVYDSKARYYTFYEVEETYNGKPYNIEKPTVVYNGRTYPLTRVEGERAWRLVGLDTAGSDARDGQLNFTLFGKTLSTRLGLSGLGLDIK